MKKQAFQKSNWPKVRKLINTIHLWLGLASGLVVIAICFSGTLYVFNTEITEWGAPHLYEIENYEGKQRIDADSLLRKVQLVAEGKVSNVTIPAAINRTYQFSVRKTEGKKPGPAVTYFVNPYSGEIVGTSKDKNSAKEFMSDMFSLHRWLLLDKVEKPIISGIENKKLGSMITGWATIIFTLGCISGLIIWFPQKLKSWKQGLKIKWKAGWKRLNHDLHNSLAFYAVFFLLLMGLTGPQWSFEWYREGLQKTLGTYKPSQEGTGEKRKEARGDSSVQKSITIAEYLKTGDSLLSYEGNFAITLPAEAGAKTMIAKTKLGFFAPAASDRITVDPATGKVMKVDIFSEKPFNERVAGSIKAIHVGNVYGTFTKLIYFLACLIATSLPITGTMIWLNKMKKTKKKNKAVKQETVSAPAVA
jgi:uncharacterized iron-regulated membrane protein